jgi:hypothetical protein
MTDRDTSDMDGAQAEQAMKRGRGRDFAFALVKMK